MAKPLYLTATKIGIRIGSTAQQVNILLAETGHLEQDGRRWVLTEKGRVVAREKQEEDLKGKKFTMVLWHESVMDELRSIAAPSRSEFEVLLARVEALEALTCEAPPEV